MIFSHFAFLYYYYIAVFAKMQFLKISVILYFSVGLLFYFSGQLFWTVSQPICTKFGTNVSSCVGLKQTRAIFEKLQNQVTTAKTSKNRSIFRTGRHIFSRSEETVKRFLQIFSAMTSRVLYISENIFMTVQNRLVFSNTLLNGASKRIDFDGDYLENRKRYGQSLYAV